MIPSYEPSDAPFDARDYVPVHDLTLDDPEPIRAIGSDDAPTVGEHLHAADFEHRPEFVEKAVALWRDDHTEARGVHSQTAPQHQSVPSTRPVNAPEY